MLALDGYGKLSRWGILSMELLMDFREKLFGLGKYV